MSPRELKPDHELTSAEDLEAKLQAGMTVEMRGSHDHLLPGFVEKLNSLGAVPQTLTLCTDDVFVDDLVENGALDDVLRRLVRYGLNGVSALQGGYAQCRCTNWPPRSWLDCTG